MGITVEWDNEAKTIIRQTFDGQWTWSDLYGALDYVQELSATVPHRVDAIVDVTESSMIPGGSIFSLNARRESDKIANRVSTESGDIVVVGGGPFIRGLYDTFIGLHGNKLGGRISFMKSVDEARNYLNTKRATEDEVAV